MLKKKQAQPLAALPDLQQRLAILETIAPIAGLAGPGRWLVATYQPTSLFSLKISLATSSVGKTFLIPTPYAIKMALVDAAFRAARPDSACDTLLRALRSIDVRIAPGHSAVVTHTFVKVRQEPKTPRPTEPYIPSIAYRELVYHPTSMHWAFDLAACDDAIANELIDLLPHISYIGKRGSFIQFRGCTRTVTLGANFTQPVPQRGDWDLPNHAHIVPLDDFGPDADLETLSSFTAKRPSRDRHRRFVNTIIPLGLINTGPGFSHYSE